MVSPLLTSVCHMLVCLEVALTTCSSVCFVPIRKTSTIHHPATCTYARPHLIQHLHSYTFRRIDLSHRASTIVLPHSFSALATTPINLQSHAIPPLIEHGPIFSERVRRDHSTSPSFTASQSSLPQSSPLLTLRAGRRLLGPQIRLQVRNLLTRR